MTAPILTRVECDGQVERIILNRPKGNIIDRDMLNALTLHLRALGEKPEARKLLVFEGAGEHFSYGASLADHLPDNVAEFIAAFHHFFRALEDVGLPTAAVVRGQCLGGGCEIALWCGQIFSHPAAMFGLPETKLGVFPPVATLALPWRIGGARATALILTGESLDGVAATTLGLADRHDVDPEAALRGWVERELIPKSTVALRAAWQATRRPLAEALLRDLPVLEKLYLNDLMAHHDPVEGVSAFMAKRAPRWKNA
jgi:cyclohexa-1,5-dienecarbonyl-CoA hydratase